jgi:hypothetical protein
VMAAKYPVENDLEECPHGVSLILIAEAEKIVFSFVSGHIRSPKTAAKLKSHYVRYGRTKCTERAKGSGNRNRLGYPAALCRVGKLLPGVRKAATVEILDNPPKQAFQLCSRRNHYYWKGKGSFRNILGATLVLSSKETAGHRASRTSPMECRVHKGL